MATALQLRNVSKVFLGQRALADVDFELERGEVHALLGQNGSGKSTLIKMLAGYHRPEPGATAALHGEAFVLGSAVSGSQMRFIHQDLGLVDGLDAVDNLALGRRYAGRWWLRDKRERIATRRLLAQFGVEIDVTASVEALTQAQRAMLAIVRAASDGLGTSQILVLDEPTAALPSSEVEQLFSLIREMRRRGGTVLYVTHRLSEVFSIADRVTVLRDGKRVATQAVESLDHDKLVELIVGRPLDAFQATVSAAAIGTPALAVSALEGIALSGVSFEVMRGEIVGVTGLVGSGYEELLHLIFGAIPARGGGIEVGGTLVERPNPHTAIQAGVAFAPADRKRLAGIAAWTLRENLTLPRLEVRGPFGWLARKAEAADAWKWLADLDVVPADPERPFASLSGGNQQKLVLARWLRVNAKVFLLEEPTNGIDMGARHAIYKRLAEVAQRGAAILLTSQDAEELAIICDRVIVLREGRIGAVLTKDELTPDRIVREGLRGVMETRGRTSAWL